MNGATGSDVGKENCISSAGGNQTFRPYYCTFSVQDGGVGGKGGKVRKSGGKVEGEKGRVGEILLYKTRRTY